MSAIIRWNYLRFIKMVKKESIGLLLGCVGRGFTEKEALKVDHNYLKNKM